ncbi:MAG: stage III sporulation protein AD [Ruminococcaceae bacterium]|nr:stage III sporulation protein AD [Oscillospiraceae bacterium]
MTMEEVMRIAAVCVIGAVGAVFLKRTSPEIGLLLVLAICAAAAAALLGPAAEVLDLLRQMMIWSGMSEEIFVPLLKTLGIALICRVSTELCRDAGQSAMATLVEMGGALGAVLVAVPLLRAVWETLQSLI